METTIFAKKRTTKEGKSFYTYLATLTKKNGEEVKCSVKFAEGKDPKPTECPLNIIIKQEDANLSTKRGTKEDGTEWVSQTLWVKDYEVSQNVWVDDSLNEFF